MKRRSQKTSLVFATAVAVVFVLGAVAFACTNYVGSLDVWGSGSGMVVGTSPNVHVTGYQCAGDGASRPSPDPCNQFMTQGVSATIVTATVTGSFKIKTYAADAGTTCYSISGQQCFLNNSASIATPSGNSGYDVNFVPIGYSNHTTWLNPAGDCMDGAASSGLTKVGTATISGGAGKVTAAGGGGTYNNNNTATYNVAATAALNVSPQEAGVCISDTSSYDGSQAPLTIVGSATGPVCSAGSSNVSDTPNGPEMSGQCTNRVAAAWQLNYGADGSSAAVTSPVAAKDLFGVADNQIANSLPGATATNGCGVDCASGSVVVTGQSGSQNGCGSVITCQKIRTIWNAPIPIDKYDEVRNHLFHGIQINTLSVQSASITDNSEVDFFNQLSNITTDQGEVCILKNAVKNLQANPDSFIKDFNPRGTEPLKSGSETFTVTIPYNGVNFSYSQTFDQVYGYKTGEYNPPGSFYGSWIYPGGSHCTVGTLSMGSGTAYLYPAPVPPKRQYNGGYEINFNDPSPDGQVDPCPISVLC